MIVKVLNILTLKYLKIHRSFEKFYEKKLLKEFSVNHYRNYR